MRIRTEVTIGILLTAVMIGTTLYGGVSTPPSAPAPIRTANTASPTGNGTPVRLNADEVAKHTTASDCWFIIAGNVYDVSGYASAHPGGAREITSYCGKDATGAFATKGRRGQPHSSRANTDLASFLLGPVGATANPGANPSGTRQQNIQQQNRRNTDRREEEDD